MGLILTAIVSPGVIGGTFLVVLAGGWVMNRIVQKKYGYTPEREKQLEEGQEQGLSEGRSCLSGKKKRY